MIQRNLNVAMQWPIYVQPAEGKLIYTVVHTCLYTETRKKFKKLAYRWYPHYTICRNAIGQNLLVPPNDSFSTKMML